jgi:uncharacterized protein (DUF1697 family)
MRPEGLGTDRIKLLLWAGVFTLLILGVTYFLTAPSEEKGGIEGKIEKALEREEVLYDSVFLTSGEEAKKAFQIPQLPIPPGALVAVIVMEKPFVESQIESYRRAIYAALDAEKGIEGVLVVAALTSQDFEVIYSGRELAEELRGQALSPYQWFDRWITYRVTVEGGTK